jgi:hypothetical protein
MKCARLNLGRSHWARYRGEVLVVCGLQALRPYHQRPSDAKVDVLLPLPVSCRVSSCLRFPRELSPEHMHHPLHIQHGSFAPRTSRRAVSNFRRSFAQILSSASCFIARWIRFLEFFSQSAIEPTDGAIHMSTHPSSTFIILETETSFSQGCKSRLLGLEQMHQRHAAPFLRTMIRKPSCLISCSHSLPEGNLSVLLGRHGEMNPAGRVRCNMRAKYREVAAIANHSHTS